MIRPQATAPQGRYHTRTLTRQIPHTIGDRTHLVTEAYEVTVPRPPRDWDRLVRAGVIGGTVLTVAISLIWSTSSIGALLARGVPPLVGYLAAIGFDTAWIICMGLEWLSRYDRTRVAAPRAAGHAFLVLAMSAITVHGGLVASWWTGGIGAAVSLIAKALWTLTLHHHARPLDDLTRQWFERESASMSARLALVDLQRQMNRAQHRIDAEQLALGVNPVAEHTPILSGQSDSNPDSVSVQVNTTPDETITDTIRRLVGEGITDRQFVMLGVQAVHGPTVREDTVDRLLLRVRTGGQP